MSLFLSLSPLHTHTLTNKNLNQTTVQTNESHRKKFSNPQLLFLLVAYHIQATPHRTHWPSSQGHTKLSSVALWYTFIAFNSLTQYSHRVNPKTGKCMFVNNLLLKPNLRPHPRPTNANTSTRWSVTWKKIICVMWFTLKVGVPFPQLATALCSGCSLIFFSLSWICIGHMIYVLFSFKGPTPGFQLLSLTGIWHLPFSFFSSFLFFLVSRYYFFISNAVRILKVLKDTDWPHWPWYHKLASLLIPFTLHSTDL